LGKHEETVEQGQRFQARANFAVPENETYLRSAQTILSDLYCGSQLSDNGLHGHRNIATHGVKTRTLVEAGVIGTGHTILQPGLH
jgi:hypothetical protein